METVTDFTQERVQWGLPYPKRGDVLTVSGIMRHSCAECRAKGIVLLFFEELPQLVVGLCDRTIDGKDNFVELMLPPALMEALEKPMVGV